MNNKELEKEVEQLREKVQSLQQENAFLMRKADESHLPGEAADQTSSPGRGGKLNPTEEKLRVKTDELSERAKKMKCLYEISKAVSETNKSKDQVLEEILLLIPPSLQYPEITCAGIFFNGWQFKTANFKETEWKQSSDIVISGKKAGRVEVYYLEEKPQRQEGPFLKEERQLIDAVAREISVYIQRKDTETALINSEETFRTLVQSISGYLYSITYDRGRPTSIYHSPQCEMITGYTPKEYKEDKDLWIKMVHKDDRDSVINFFDSLKNYGSSSPLEHRIIHKQGQIKWVLNRCSLTLDDKGHIERTDGIVLDITEHKKVEETVLESERKFRAIFDNAVDGITLISTESREFTLVNKMFCLMTGYSQEEFVNMGVLDMHPEEALTHVIEQLERLSRGEIEAAENIPVKRKDGSIFYADIKASTYWMGGEKCLLGIFRDITERKQAEEAISRALSERNTILETALVGIILIKSRKVVWANSKMEEIFRCEKKDLIGKETDQLYASFPDYEETRRKTHPLMIKGETYRTELLMMRKEGSHFWCSIMGRVVEVGEPKKGSIWIIEDITGRKEAEDALRESERSLYKINEVFLTLGIDHEKNINNLTALAGQLLGGCCAIYNRLDKEGLYSAGRWNTPPGYKIVNKGDGHICYDVIRYAKDRIFIVHGLKNTPFAQTDPNIVANKIHTYVGHAVRCGHDYVGSLCVLYQHDFIPEDEHKKTMGIVASAIGLEEERIRSEQYLKKARKEAEEATTLKDKFVSLVAHDLRAPITVIRGYLQLLSQESFDPEVKEDIYSETIASCDDMTHLINEVLNLSKMTSEGISPECNFIHASELIEKSIYNYTVLAEKKGIELTNELPENMRIYSDERLMLEAASNIISNAVKFCRKGDKIRVYKPDGESTTMAVADTGIGIKPDRLDDLFKYEAKTSTRGTSGEMGTGFGLPLSRDILSAHGGELTVQSFEGEGSTFFLRLPFIKPQVLVVDDEQIVIDSIKNYLETIDVDILGALNGESAIDALERGYPHLILLDIYLPGIDGFEILEKFKGDPKTRNIPIIVITGAPNMKVHERVFQLGADDLVYKPFKGDDLIPRVKKFVR
ncbi:MAG: PAS domain S-box protein [bacterium]|nr:PAS domain S-box protein [bacterium]